jgi:hypothetical protein
LRFVIGTSATLVAFHFARRNLLAGPGGSYRPSHLRRCSINFCNRVQQTRWISPQDLFSELGAAHRVEQRRLDRDATKLLANLYAKRRKTLVSSLLFLLISIGRTGTAEAQLASPQCDACRKACINARESCKVYTCLTSGGQPGPSSCQGPNARYVADLQACEQAESTCLDRCANTAPNCR